MLARWTEIFLVAAVAQVLAIGLLAAVWPREAPTTKRFGDAKVVLADKMGQSLYSAAVWESNQGRVTCYMMLLDGEGYQPLGSVSCIEKFWPWD